MFAEGNFSTMQRPEFVSLDNTFICVHCQQALIGAFQTPCGHRICSPCLDDLFKQNESADCPAKDDECIPLTKNQICKDFTARKALLNLEVYCVNQKYGCQHTMSWKEYLNDDPHFSVCAFKPVKCTNEGCSFIGGQQQIQDHLIECPFLVKICSNCNKTIMLQKESIAEHLNKCQNQEMRCHYFTFGCDVTGNGAILKKHFKEAISHHMSLLAIYFQKLEVGLLNIEKDVKANSRENARIESLFQGQLLEMQAKMAILDKYAATELENKKKFVNLSEVSIAQTLEFRSLKEHVQRQLQNGQNTGTNQNVNTLIEQILEQTSVHDREIGVHDVRFSEMEARLASLETRSYDGKLVWKIANYTKLKANTKTSKQSSIYSQPFYSSRFGYKMRSRIYPNGDGDGKGTHMSFFFVLMKGEYDNVLSWPFQHKVTLTLLDQVNGKKNLSDSFMPDPNSISFNKPVTEMNVATGCPCFITQSHLNDPVYMVDDTIFLQICIAEK